MRNKRLRMIALVLAAAVFMTAIPVENVYGKEAMTTTERSPKVQEEIPAALNYLYVNEAEQEVGDEQNMVVSWGNGTEAIRYIKLILENEKGEKQSIVSSYDVDGVFLFNDSFEKGMYRIVELMIVTWSTQKNFSMNELGIRACFSVGKTCSDEQKSEHVEMENIVSDKIETKVVTIDGDGVATAQSSIADALEELSSSEVSVKVRLL